MFLHRKQRYTDATSALEPAQLREAAAKKKEEQLKENERLKEQAARVSGTSGDAAITRNHVLQLLALASSLGPQIQQTTATAINMLKPVLETALGGITPPMTPPRVGGKCGSSR